MDSFADPPLQAVDLRPYRGAVDDPAPPADGFLAAVALVLRHDPETAAGSGGEFLLIRRARSEQDPWSGHMALPGGRRDSSDGSLQETAIRETREETGIDLGASGSLLGCLSPVEPRSPLLPAISILPFVFRLETPTELRPRTAEVADAFWAPLEVLARPAAKGVYHHVQDGVRIAFPAIQVNGHTVWGLTHRILTDFSRRRG